MKKVFYLSLLALTLCPITMAYAQRPADLKVYSKNLFKEGAVVLENTNFQRKFLQKTSQGYYQIQDFYKTGEKFTDPFIVKNHQDITAEKGLYYIGNISITGPYITWSKTGKKLTDYTFEEGKPVGVFIDWNEKGQKRSETIYKNGQVESSLRFYPDDNKEEHSTFKNGLPDGTWSTWDKNSQKLSEIIYKNGLKKSEGMSVNGIKEGKWTFYWEGTENKKEEGSYKNDKPEGLWTYWSQLGNKNYKSKYQQGRLIGSAIVRDRSAQGTYKNDDSDELWTYWHKNGQKKSEGKYKNDKQEGLWKSWDKNGTKLKDQFYENGVIKKEKEKS